MTDKQLNSNVFEDLTKGIHDLRMSLCIFMAEWILAMPIGLSYENWVLLHQIKGDWE